MIGAIPNPSKTLQIDYPHALVNAALDWIPHYGNKYTLSKKSEAFSLYTFDALEFLSLGVHVDVSTNAISDTRTSLTIEVRRKIGSFDQAHEVSKASEHISNIIALLETTLTSDHTAKLAEITEREGQAKERKRLEEEERLKNPAKYHAKQWIATLVVVAICAAILYGLYSLVTYEP